MKKISTLFKKDPSNLALVINEVNGENSWVYSSTSIPTVKYDGTSCMILGGTIFKRYDVKGKRKVPVGAIPCQEKDAITGHHPHWVLCDRGNPSDKYHFMAYDRYLTIEDGTYELCGPNVNGNNEKLDEYCLIKHGEHVITDLENYTYETIREYLRERDIEGIVFHDSESDKMCKIRKKDFGFER